LIVVAMRQQGQWRQCRVPAGIRAKVKQPTIFSALLLASYIHCCSHCPRQLHVAVATTITIIVFAAVVVTVTVVATFAIAVVAAAAVAIILAVRVTAASLFRRCCRFTTFASTLSHRRRRCGHHHHHHVIVVASLPLSPFVALLSLLSHHFPLSPSPSPPCHHFCRCSAVPTLYHRCHRCCHHRHHHIIVSLLLPTLPSALHCRCCCHRRRCHSTLKKVLRQRSRTAVNLPVCAIACNFQHGVK